MATVDQRILIPASQEFVWAYLSDIGNNPSWQIDCRAVSFLSSKRQGAGTRWRATDEKGDDAIYEALSWYNGLGYEYTCVDGCTYRESRVRIRLQEIAEGTIVQWTYSFEPKGMLSGIRGGTRQLENVMAASLKSLYRQVKAANKSGQLASRSLMQDSPDVSGRYTYQPRHSSQYDEKKLTPSTPMPVIAEPPVVADDGQELEAFVFEEPPIVESDTRPHPTVTETGESAALKAEKTSAEVQAVLDEPDFIADIPTPAESPDFDLDVPVAGTAETFVDDAIFAPPVEVEEPAAPLPSQVMTDALDVVVSPAEAEPVVEDKPAPEPSRASRLEVTSVDPLETQDLPPLERELPTVLPVPAGEVGHRSIWEIFGVPKPSDTGTTAPAVQVSEETVAAAPAGTTPEPEKPLPFRHGFRARERRKIARIRYPQ